MVDRTQGLTALASQSVAAAGSAASSTITLGDTALGAIFYGRVTNGATGPTLPMRVRVEISRDGTNWHDTGIGYTAGVAASTSYDFAFSAPAEAFAVRALAVGHTGQAVTVETFYDLLVSM